MGNVKTIGILTSGGDAPGMNPAVRAATRAAIEKGLKVKGIIRGYQGLIDCNVIDLDEEKVCNIIQKGGTVLYSARCLAFKEEKGVKLAAENCKKLGIDGIVVIGGDGSFRGARDLSARGIPCVGIPGTIDNDISSTEYTLGFDTALNTAIDMIDRLRDTCFSHDRCAVVQIMGRGAGHLALHTGIAAGATAILIPEAKIDLQKDLIDKINHAKKLGKTNFIVCMAEGYEEYTPDEIARLIQDKTGVESRATILGHVQRGGSPTGRDRVIASLMGNHAANLLSQGIGNRVVAYKEGIGIVDYDIFEALNMKKDIERNLLEVHEKISI